LYPSRAKFFGNIFFHADRLCRNRWRWKSPAIIFAQRLTRAADAV
jgi:hypothetical protein